MVATVTGQPNFSFQPQNVAGPAEVRARNDQTQPRTAPAADSQNSEHRTLQSKEESFGKKESKKLAQGEKSSSPGTAQRRGSFLDVVA